MNNSLDCIIKGEDKVSQSDLIENELFNILSSNGYAIEYHLKLNPNKRYTYKIRDKKGKNFLGKCYKKKYLNQQYQEHFGIDILKTPKQIDSLSNLYLNDYIDEIDTDLFVIRIFEFINGEDLEKISRYGDDDIINKVSNNLFELIKDFISFRTYDGKGFGPYNEQDMFSSWDIFFKIFMEEKISKCYELEIINDEIRYKLNELLNCTTLKDIHNIVHYDFSPSNIIYNDGYLYVIDRDGYYIGDFKYSIAKILYYFYSDGKYYIYKLLFEKCKAIISEDEINFYLIFVLVEKMIISKNNSNRFKIDKRLFESIINLY